MKTYFLTICVLLSLQTVCAQEQVEIQSNKSVANSTQQGDAELRARVKIQAEEMSKAFLAGEYEKVFELTHPKIQNLIGKEKFISSIKVGTKSAEAEGFKLVALDVAEPAKIIRIGSQMFAVVPQKMRMQTPQGVFVGESSEIAVSEDGGKTWKFVGGGAGGGMSKEKFRALFPAAADKLEIPEVKPPVPYHES